MTTIEEHIWDYIDGNCDPASQSEIEHKIATNENYKALYFELYAIHQQIGEISLDEPAMAFNRKVMDLVNLEIAPVSLKTKVDNRIIYSIAGFFILLIGAIFIYTLLQIGFAIPKLTLTTSLNLNQYLTPALIRGFVFFDIIIGLLYLDGLLRRKKLS